MSPLELAIACKKAIETAAYKNLITIVVPFGPPRGRRIRLAGSRSPLGDVISFGEHPPRTTALFDAYDVLAWLHANNLVTCTFGESHGTEKTQSP